MAAAASTTIAVIELEGCSSWVSKLRADSGSAVLWRRAARSFSRVRLCVLAALSAAVFLSGLGLALVMLSAGVIRG